MDVPTSNPVTEPVNVNALPQSQSPANSEDTFLRLQKQRPLPAGNRPLGEKPRPGDIAVGRSSNADGEQSHTHTDVVSASLRQLGTPQRSSSPFGNFRSASPRHLSPATSQIFERDVQESTLAPELSPAIPSHIQTEDHIPPVLEASSEVITSKRLGVDDVEIVTHSAHVPAAAATSLIDPGMSSSAILSASGSEPSHSPPYEQEDLGSTYGAVDPTDPRRLSFISFADVVHAEHVDAGSGSLHVGASSVASIAGPRSPSPARSPPNASTASPPRSGSISMQGGEISPTRGGPGSVMSSNTGQHGELTIETMRQAIEKPGAEIAAPGTPVS